MAERARLTGGQTTIAPIPSIGVTDAAAKNLTDFASGLAKIGDQAQTQLDIQAVQEGEKAGIIAGLSPKFEVLGDATLRARAYDRAGLNVFVNQTDIATQAKIDELYQENQADPIALKAALNGWREGFRADMEANTPQAVPYFDQSFARNTRPVIFAAERQFRDNLEKEARASLVSAVETSTNAAARLAFLSDASPEAAGDLVAARNALIDKLVENGPQGAFTFEGRTMSTDITRQKVLDVAQMQKVLADWDEQAYSQTVLGRFSRAPDKRKFFETFSKEQQEDTASPIGIDTVKRIQAEMRGALIAEDAERRARRAELKDGVTDAVYVLNRGRLPAGLGQLRAAVAGDPELSAEVEGAIQDRAVAGEFLKLNPGEQRAALTALTQDKNAPTDRRSVELTARLEALHNETLTGLRDDPITFGAEAGLYALPVMDPAKPETIAARVRAARIVEDRYGVVSSGLTAPEVEQVTRRIAGADADGKVGYMQSFNAALGRDRAGVLWGQVAKKQPAFALAASIADQSPGLASEIIRGQALVDTMGGGAIPGPVDYRPKADATLRAAFKWSPSSAENVTNAALAVELVRRASTGKTTSADFDKGVFSEALTEITGGILLQPNGGRVDRIVAPVRGMSQDRFYDLFDSLADDDVAGALAGTSKITAKDIKRYGVLESVGDGRYLVRIANGYAMTAAGDPFQLDLGAIARKRGGR